jgi:hypothetical protein
MYVDFTGEDQQFEVACHLFLSGSGFFETLLGKKISLYLESR